MLALLLCWRVLLETTNNKLPSKQCWYGLYHVMRMVASQRGVLNDAVIMATHFGDMLERGIPERNCQSDANLEHAVVLSSGGQVQQGLQEHRRYTCLNKILDVVIADSWLPIM